MSLNPEAEVKLALAAISGVPEPNAEKLRRVRKQISKRLENVANGELLAVAQKLIDADRRWIGYELVSRYQECLRSLQLYDVEALGQNIDSWSSVDAFAVYIAGPCWANGQISDAAIARWARRDNRWWRRTALVATTGLNVPCQSGSFSTRVTQ